MNVFYFYFGPETAFAATLRHASFVPKPVMHGGRVS